MKLRNLTPHSINITHGSAQLTLPPGTQPLPRIRETATPAGTIHHDSIDIPLVNVHATTTANLPPPQPDTLLIVPRIIADSHPERIDLVVPYDTIRNPQGQIVGCTSLARITTNHATPGQHRRH